VATRYFLYFVPTILIMSLCAPVRSSAQETLIEWLLEHDVELSDQTAALDYLEDLEHSPVQVNTALPSEFLRIPGIMLFQAQSIIAEREKTGPFTSLESVKKAGAIPDDWFVLIERFMALLEKQLFSFDIRQRNTREIEKPRAYASGAYAGSIVKNYTRIKMSSYHGINCGVLLEKDPGEQKLTDHAARYVQWNSSNKNVVITAGDYSLDYGQGVLFSRWGFFGKSNDPLQPLFHRDAGIKGYVSASEGEGMRGITGWFTHQWLQFGVFYSDTHRDARIDSDNLVTNIPVSGYHRTETERIQKDQLRETLHGVRIKFTPYQSLAFGVTQANLRYTPAFAADEPGDKLFVFSGKKLRLISTDFNLILKQLHVFGELGTSRPGSYGLVTGLIWSSGSSGIGIHFRDYKRDFYSPSGGSFSHKMSEIRNERGFYIGLKHSFNRRFRLSLYSDIYEYPWRSSSIPVGRSGADLFVQLKTRFVRGKEVVINWRRRTQTEKTTYLNDYGIQKNRCEKAIGDRIRIQSSVELNKNTNVFIRGELQTKYYPGRQTDSFAAALKNPGMLISARLRYSYSRLNKFFSGITIFTSDNTRFYQYEHDLPGLLTIKQLSRKGERFSLLYSRAGSYGKLSIKYGIVHYRDRDTIGTGNSTIYKSYKQEFGIQFDISLK